MSADDKKPKSHLVPLWQAMGGEEPSVDIDTAIEEILEFRRNHTLGDISAVELIRQMRDGRYSD